jgi:hypothetical protein
VKAGQTLVATEPRTPPPGADAHGGPHGPVEGPAGRGRTDVRRPTR